jgi:hypothetical protein
MPRLADVLTDSEAGKLDVEIVFTTLGRIKMRIINRGEKFSLLLATVTVPSPLFIVTLPDLFTLVLG